MTIKYSDVLVEGSTFECSLFKLTGKRIKDVQFYLSDEFGQPTIKLTNLIFEDDSEMGFEGEHEFPYLVIYKKWPQPNCDDETLARLLDGHQADED